MIKVLEDNKKIIKAKEKNWIIVTAKIDMSCFTGKDKDAHAPFFALPKTFKGVAKLKDGDSNNEVEAIRIAESKMERAYYKYIRKCQKELIESIEKYSEYMHGCLTRTERNISHANSHIEEICSRL